MAGRRVLKAPGVRRAELIDCAQGLFLTRGYEATTINDVINATGLSKGAFYHHFRSKEELLEAIAQRFARDCVAFCEGLEADPGPDAAQRLNRFLTLGRNWKAEHIVELKTMFTTLLRPENAVLYQRIGAAMLAVLAPALARVIAAGQADGVFADGDPRVAADALLWLSNGRRGLEIDALALAERDLEAALEVIARRVRAEEVLVCRMLGVPTGAIDLLGPEEDLREMLAAWADGGRTPRMAGAASEPTTAR